MQGVIEASSTHNVLPIFGLLYRLLELNTISMLSGCAVSAPYVIFTVAGYQMAPVGLAVEYTPDAIISRVLAIEFHFVRVTEQEAVSVPFGA